MEIIHLGTHCSYGIKLWKSGMISLRTTTIAVPSSTLCIEDARRSQAPVARGQGIRSTCYFFVCLKLFVFLCFVKKKIYLPIYRVLNSVEYFERW